jgi:2-phospho-L-lactate guanylyltransferase
VKSFTMAKGRLADTLTGQERSALAQSCAETVVRAALSLPTYVVCSDAVVAEWATSLGARVVDCQTPGLDIAVATGRAAAEADGANHIVVAHADLPLAVSFNHIAREGKVSLVPDRHRDGTNVLSFPVNSSFTTAYGPGSCDNHIRLAINAGLEYEIIEDNDLALDLDTADDLSELARRETEQS